MQPIQATILQRVANSAGSHTADATLTSSVVDTFLAPAYIEYNFSVDTDTALASVIVQEADTLDGSALEDPTTLYEQAAAVPAGTASSGGLWVIGLDMRGPHKRYQAILFAVPTPASGHSGALIVCDAVLSRPDNTDPTATTRRLANAEYAEVNG